MIYLHTGLQRNLSWIYVFKGLTWTDIIAVKSITMHVSIILRSFCLIYQGMLRLTNIRVATIFATWRPGKYWIQDGFQGSIESKMDSREVLNPRWIPGKYWIQDGFQESIESKMDASEVLHPRWMPRKYCIQDWCLGSIASKMDTWEVLNPRMFLLPHYNYKFDNNKNFLSLGRNSNV